MREREDRHEYGARGYERSEAQGRNAKVRASEARHEGGHIVKVYKAQGEFFFLFLGLPR
jgi:hypothetical protein